MSSLLLFVVFGSSSALAEANSTVIKSAVISF